MKSLLRRCNIITGGTWQWQKSEPRSYDAGISQPWCVPFCLQLCSSIKSTASVQGPGGRTLSSVTLSSVCKSKLLWTEEMCWCRHCTRQLIVFTQTLYTQRDSLSIFTGLYQYSMPTVCACVLNALCVVYIGHVFSVKVRYSVTLNPLLSAHTYHTVCSITSFPVWQKISDFYKHLQPSLCRGNISWNSCIAHERSLWQEHWLLLLPAGHVVFLHTRSIIHIPLANI